MLSASIPGYEALPIRPHLFANLGGITNINTNPSITPTPIVSNNNTSSGKSSTSTKSSSSSSSSSNIIPVPGIFSSFTNTLSNLWSSRKISLGAGVAIPLGQPRIELNAATVHTPGQGFSKLGFSGGVSLEF